MVEVEGETQSDFFLSPDERRVFALVVEGQKVYVNREFLACYSPVFGKIFYPEGAVFEQPEGGMLMKEKKLDEFLVFLHVVYPSPTPLPVAESNLSSLLGYADEYNVAVLRQRCVAYMTKQLKKGRVKGEGLVDYLRLALLYNLADLQKQLVPLVAKLSFDQIKAAHGVLSGAVLAAVYQSKALHLSGNPEAASLKPLNEFLCYKCKQACSIVKSSSSCCGYYMRVTQTKRDPPAQCSFTCSKCSNAVCGIRANGGSSCCDYEVFVKRPAENCAECKQKTSAFECTCRYDAFSADLLVKNH